MAKPLTIFLPTYNRPEYTKAALESCLRQTYPHFNIIMSDDTPTDAVREIVEAARSERITYRQNKPMLGLIAKLNWFIENCPTEWAVILGDDDWLEPAYLETMAGLIDKHPDAALIRTRCRIVDPSGRLLRIDAAEKGEMSPFEAFGSYFKPWHEIQINISGVLFKPALMRQVGGFPDYHQGYHVDQISWVRLSQFGPTIFSPEALITLRRFDSGALSSQFDSRYEMFLDTKRRMLADTRAVYENLLARAGRSEDRLALEAGWKLFEAHLADCVHYYMDQLFIELLKNPAVGGAEIRKAGDQMRQLRLKPSASLVYLEGLAALPYRLRRIGLGVYRKSRHLGRRFFRGGRFSALVCGLVFGRTFFGDPAKYVEHFLFNSLLAQETLSFLAA